MRLLLILSLAVGLASATTVEIQNRKECYSLPASNVGDCLNATRAGRTYLGETDTSSPVAQDEAQPTQSERRAPTERKGKSLEVRSVEAQESLASAQHSIANAMWTQIFMGSAGAIIAIIIMAVN